MEINLLNNGTDDLFLVSGETTTGVLDSINYLKEGNVTEILYGDLVALRDASGLTPGRCYRITDYVTTTSQPYTRSAGHQFDLIVSALSENTISEVASAVAHEGDTYFENCNLSAWQLKYCLDNDTNKYYWALPTGEYIRTEYKTLYVRSPENDDLEAEHSYAWRINGNVTLAYSDEENVAVLDLLYNANSSAATVTYKVSEIGIQGGKGVIYRMTDERGNTCEYDFKNIQYFMYISRYLTSSTYASTQIDDKDNLALFESDGYEDGFYNFFNPSNFKAQQTNNGELQEIFPIWSTLYKANELGTKYNWLKNPVTYNQQQEDRPYYFACESLSHRVYRYVESVAWFYTFSNGGASYRSESFYNLREANHTDASISPYFRGFNNDIKNFYYNDYWILEDKVSNLPYVILKNNSASNDNGLRYFRIYNTKITGLGFMTKFPSATRRYLENLTINNVYNVIFANSIERTNINYMSDSKVYTVRSSTIESVNYMLSPKSVYSSSINKSGMIYLTDQITNVQIKESQHLEITNPLQWSVIHGTKYVKLTTNQTTSSSAYLNNLILNTIHGAYQAIKVISHDTLNDEFVTTYQPMSSQIISL